MVEDLQKSSHQQKKIFNLYKSQLNRIEKLNKGFKTQTHQTADSNKDYVCSIDNKINMN